MRVFSYVGPEEIRAAVADDPRGCVIGSAVALADWAATPEARADSGWATYVVSAQGELRVAPRRTEHVACAGGEPVRGAGELRVSDAGEIVEISNNSTGYCPAEDTWPSVERTLEALGIAHPGDFTFTAVFRRCEACGQRNLVKDEWFVCGVCEAELSPRWNFDSPSP